MVYFLGVAIGICALTYYNAYGFILCSIIVYCMSSYKLHFTFNEFLKKGFLIAIAALVVGGWFFIRNAMIIMEIFRNEFYVRLLVKNMQCQVINYHKETLIKIKELVCFL